MNHFFAYINRMRFIQRWSLMRNSYTENIQEHSHQTAVLAHALAVLRNERFGGQVDVGAVAVAALYHDAGEILTGDMPTPIKYYNPGIREAYKAVEQVAEDKLLSMLPEDLRPAYEDALRPADPEIEQLVRAADKLSAHIKCLEELKAGNAEFREAAAQTRRALEAFDLPEVAYFMDTFLPSFSLTLDELKGHPRKRRPGRDRPGRRFTQACSSLERISPPRRRTPSSIRSSGVLPKLMRMQFFP